MNDDTPIAPRILVNEKWEQAMAAIKEDEEIRSANNRRIEKLERQETNQLYGTAIYPQV